MAEEQVVESAEEAVVETPETLEETPEETQIETPAEPPKKTAQERINEITRKRREAEREAEYWKSKALTKETPPVTVAAPIAAPGRPTLDQYDTTEQYEDALFTWRDNIKAGETAKQTAAREYESNMQAFNQRAKALRSEHDDFDEVIEAEVFTEGMKAAILQSEKGPELAYYLGQPANIDIAEKIRALPVERQIYEMGKLETKLSIAKQTKKIPGAPAPVTPVGSGGGVTPREQSAKMPIEEWMAIEREKEFQKRKKEWGG